MDRVERFEHLRFGMFIHFGLYSIPARGEWSYHLLEDVRKEYDGLRQQFEPKLLDWDEIVLRAKRAGMKYITLTSRHHDGFSLYDTKGLSDCDVMHTPYGRDIIRDFTDSCRRHGMVPFLYHTMHDWQNTLFREDFNAYLEWHRKCIELLCTQYGELGGFWFDGNWSGDQDWQEDQLYGMIRKYQPDAILINNSGLDERGKKGHPELDAVTFEQGHLQKRQDVPGERHLAAEVCETVNHHWGAAVQDLDYRSVRDCIETLALCRGEEANYLLNTGLSGLGEIPDMEKAILTSMGIWMDSVKDVFADGERSSVEADGRDFVLDKDGRSYVFVFDLPQLGVAHAREGKEEDYKTVILRNVTGKVRQITWLDNGEEQMFSQTGTEITAHMSGFGYGTNLIVRAAVIEYV